jgi:ABC-2 type transport system permease protein
VLTVARQELRGLWLGGRGLPLLFGFSALLSVVTYLAASNKTINYLETREAVNLALQVAVAVGALLTLLVAADAVSGERERGTLETLLLTPVARSQLVAGKLLAALSLWLAAIVVTVPYVWFLGHGVGAVGDAVISGFVIGSLIAVGLAAFGIVVSIFSRSNRLSLSVCLFALLALFAPTQFPTGAQTGWVADLLQRANPLTAGEHYIGKVVVDQHGWTHDAAWLISPIAAAAVIVAIAIGVAPRLMTLGGGSSR